MPRRLYHEEVEAGAVVVPKDDRDPKRTVVVVEGVRVHEQANATSKILSADSNIIALLILSRLGNGPLHNVPRIGDFPACDHPRALVDVVDPAVGFGEHQDRGHELLAAQDQAVLADNTDNCTN